MTFTSYFTARRCLLLASFATLVGASGCWQKVEYKEPAPTAAEEKSSRAKGVAANVTEPPASDSKTAAESSAVADEFGAELATKLSEETPPVTPSSPLDTNPATEPETTPDSSAIVGDRYTTKAPEETTPPTPDTSAASAPSDASASTAAVDPLFGEPVDSNTPSDSPVNDSMLPEQREAIAEMSPTPIPNLNDDEIPTTTAEQAWNTRRAAWLLGSKLSLAALGNDHGAPVDNVQKLFSQSSALATKLGIALKSMPARPTGAATRQATGPGMDYLFSEGQEIGGALAQKGADLAALFEVAVKSNILLVIYKPDSPTTKAIADAIERAGERAKLPATLWQPLIDTLAAKGSLTDVRKAVFELHEATDKYLDEAPR